MSGPHAARDVILGAIGAGAFPAAVVEVGTPDRVLWREAFGRLTGDPDARPAGETTVFDLASLTKVIATTTVAMRLVENGRLRPDDPVHARLPAWEGKDRRDVTVRDLLEHASGLPAWLPLHERCAGRTAYVAAICRAPLDYLPRSQSVYSDLGFILLGIVLELEGGEPLDAQFASTVGGVLMDPGEWPLVFNPPIEWRPRIAPTEVDPWRGRLLVGEVHDENAWALGGVAGHAGLFGTAPAVGRFAQHVLRARLGIDPAPRRLASPATMAAFTARSAVPGSSRALGWDTMLPTSSCGTRMSPSAFGHTGFTGTSLWIDPGRQVYIVFLTNRVHPTRGNERIRDVRPALHDAILDGLAAWP